jgi:large subunit ribosomal protein L9
MKIILKKEVHKLGQPGDIVEVKNGYGRNYLVPQGIAIFASDSNMKVYQQDLKSLAKKALKGQQEAQEFADKLSQVSVTAAVQVGEEEKLFGSVTSQNIADLLKEIGHDIDRRKILLDEPIKALGVYDVPIKLHPEVTAQIKVWVVKE